MAAADGTGPLMRASMTIPTLFCINASYAKHVAVCIVSLLENNPDAFFELVVVSTGDLGGEAAKLRRTVAAYSNCTLKMKRLAADAGRHLPIRGHYSIDNYTRLWVTDFFADSVSKVLYLDSDMVVVGDVTRLWQMDMGNAIIGAVTIPGSDRCAAFGIPESYGYFNSGVLLMDLAKWRRENVFPKLMDYLGNNAEKIVDADQDVLNACLYDRRLDLPYIYNVISPFYFTHHPLGLTDAAVETVRRDAAIVHFNGASKPWSYMSHHPRRADYWRYLAHTEWRGEGPADRNFTNWTKKTIGPLLPDGLRAYVRAKVSALAG